MTAAYVDTSCLVAIAFAERGARAVVRRLSRFDQLISSPLLEAELASALAREGRSPDAMDLSAIRFVRVERSLRGEILRVLGTGYVRGGDCWHLATALYLSPVAKEMPFLTLDNKQRAAARKLGFRV